MRAVLLDAIESF